MLLLHSSAYAVPQEYLVLGKKKKRGRERKKGGKKQETVTYLSIFLGADSHWRWKPVQLMHESQFTQLAWRSEWHRAPVSMEESRRNVFAYSQYTQIKSPPWGFAALHEVSDAPNACARNPQTFVLVANADSRAGNAAGICLTHTEV